MTDGPAFRETLGRRLAAYLRLRDEAGHERALEALLGGHTGQHRARMGPLIEDGSLVEGFARARARFAALGVEQEVLDASTAGADAVLEINRTCICLDAAGACGLAEPIGVLCELELEATRRAFPEMRAEALRRRVDGACVCVFLYQRPARAGRG